MGGGEFPILDAILVLVVLLELALGWLRGLLASVFGLVGLVAGAIAGTLLVGQLPWTDLVAARGATALGLLPLLIVVLCAAFAQQVGLVVGRSARRERVDDVEVDARLFVVVTNRCDEEVLARAADRHGELPCLVVPHSGLTRGQMQDAGDIFARSNRVMGIYGMGITQHRLGVQAVQMLMNLLLVGGHIGRPGAGICPVRGHSNVQGDRTMGIDEKPSTAFLDRLRQVGQRHLRRGAFLLGHRALGQGVGFDALLLDRRIAEAAARAGRDGRIAGGCGLGRGRARLTGRIGRGNGETARPLRAQIGDQIDARLGVADAGEGHLGARHVFGRGGDEAVDLVIAPGRGLGLVLGRFCNISLCMQTGKGSECVNLCFDILHPQVSLAEVLELLHSFIGSLESRGLVQHVASEELIQAG